MEGENPVAMARLAHPANIETAMLRGNSFILDLSDARDAYSLEEHLACQSCLGINSF
jgi:hypothetical protein